MFLIQVTYSYYCAGIVCDKGAVIKAAPILFWIIGKNTAWLRKYFDNKNIKYELIEEFNADIKHQDFK